jgi:hypothetical protein
MSHAGSIEHRFFSSSIGVDRIEVKEKCKVIRSSAFLFIRFSIISRIFSRSRIF